MFIDFGLIWGPCLESVLGTEAWNFNFFLGFLTRFLYRIVSRKLGVGVLKTMFSYGEYCKTYLFTELVFYRFRDRFKGSCAGSGLALRFLFRWFALLFRCRQRVSTRLAWKLPAPLRWQRTLQQAWLLLRAFARPLACFAPVRRWREQRPRRF